MGPRLDAILAACAILLIVLLPVTALAVPPRDVTWSALDPNLVYVRSPPGSVDVGPAGMTFSVANATVTPLVNAASMSSHTIVELWGQFTIPPGSRPSFSVRFSSPYDESSCNLTLDPFRDTIAVVATGGSGSILSSQVSGGFTASSPFDVQGEFVPNGVILYRVTQAGTGQEFACYDAGLAASSPVNLDLLLTTTRGDAGVTLTALHLTLPASGNRQYEATSLALGVEYAAIVVLSAIAFRRPLLRGARSVLPVLRNLQGRSRRFYSHHRLAILATIVAITVQALVTFLGSHPYDIFTQELWSYISAHYGSTSIFPMSALVPGGKPNGFVSPIGSFCPYPPLPLYFFAGIGYAGELLTPSAPVPSLLYANLTKSVWLAFLNATAWVVYLELGRKGIANWGRVGIFLLVALNPGLLMDLAVWGQFEIVVAFFLLLSFVGYARGRAGYALFFLLLALLTKQTALFVAIFLIPLYLASWGPRRVATSLARGLVAVFFLLLPLFLVGLSPTYVVRVTAGDVLFNAILPTPVGTAPWQQTVTSGAFNLWPLVTGWLNGQAGLQRLSFPDSIPGPVFGLPYLVLGAGLAAIGFVALALLTAYARRKDRLSYTLSLLIALTGFLWIFTVMTRMSGRYLSLAVPLIALLWSSARNVRFARLLLGLTSLVLTFSLMAQLGVTAVEIPPALEVFRSSAVLAFSNEFVTLLSLGEVIILALAALALIRGVRGEEFLPPRTYPSRADLPALPGSPKVSVIILNYNGGDLAGRCALSVLADPYPNKEVLVVDNASTDASLVPIDELVRACRVNLVRNETNLSFARGNNRGADHASGELLFFLNNDTEVEPGTIGKLVDKFLGNPGLGAAQPLVCFLPQKDIVNSAGNLLDTLAFNDIVGFSQSRGSFTSTERTSYAVGAALMIPRVLFHRVGGFDEVLDFYYTDADLSWKGWLAGFSVVVVPEATVFHAEGSSLRKFGSVRRLQMIVRTQLTVVAKNFELPRALAATWSLITLYLGVAAMYLVRGDLAVPRAVVNGIGSFIASMPRVSEARHEVQKLRTISDASARREFLVPFNPVRVFLRKRGGWGYLSDRDESGLE